MRRARVLTPTGRGVVGFGIVGWLVIGGAVARYLLEVKW